MTAGKRRLVNDGHIKGELVNDGHSMGQLVNDSRSKGQLVNDGHKFDSFWGHSPTYAAFKIVSKSLANKGHSLRLPLTSILVSNQAVLILDF